MFIECLLLSDRVLTFLGSGDPPTSTSQVAGTTGMNYHAWLCQRICFRQLHEAGPSSHGHHFTEEKVEGPAR
jgi:hypothetical protein